MNLRHRMASVKKTLNDFLSDTDDPGLPAYDPVQVGGMIVLVLFGMTVLFWLLWALLVCGGGVQAKILPGLMVVCTPKTLQDYGYVGYPYEMGVFNGWVANVIALVFACLALAVIWYVFEIVPDASSGDVPPHSSSESEEPRQ